MEREKALSASRHKATHVALLKGRTFREDTWAENYFCGEESEDFGVKFACKTCLQQEGIIW
jgi:hypothetical protein